MHIPADYLREELIRTPGMTRFCVSRGSTSEREATLIVKCSSMITKMIMNNCTFRIAFIVLQPENALLYGMEIDDDPVHPNFIWSIVERADELEAIKKAISGEYLVIHLFNEAAVSVGWAEPSFNKLEALAELINDVEPHPGASERSVERVRSFLDESPYRSFGEHPFAHVMHDPNHIEWHQVNVTYITNNLGRSTISVLSGNEGNQQEQIAVWLTDNLCLEGAFNSPIAHEPKKARELTDVLFSHRYGAFLIESKSISIFTNKSIPNREDMTNTTIKHIRKATNQHVGACRNIFNGVRITSSTGDDLEIPRDKPPHCIILISDLSLISHLPEFGGSWIRNFAEKTSCFLHILDPNALMGVVLNANYLAERGTIISPLMAFDAILVERWKQAIEIDTAYFRFTMEDGENPS